MKKILMASLAMTIFAFSSLLFQLASCKKASGQPDPCPECPSCPEPTYQVAGLYTGTYSVDSKPEQGDLYYSFVVFPNGDLLTKDVIEMEIQFIKKAAGF